jgi:hemerythrin-like domain-containing protein/quercetin dioxygenase-like cupin family protein
MKRHASLVPLSHDHHHALVEARRLGRAADGTDAARCKAAADFLRFFSTETVRHFREEEEHLFPTLVGHEDADERLLVRALLEHQRIHASVSRLEHALAADEVDASAMRELAELLEAHVRLEEREIFPRIEQIVPREVLSELDLEPSRVNPHPPVVDLLAPDGRGPVWGAETEDLNATLLAWPAKGGTDEHVNSERDLMVVVLSGSATVAIDGEPHEVRAWQAVILKKGDSRRITAGPIGVRYLSVHLRRAPLLITPRGATARRRS